MKSDDIQRLWQICWSLTKASLREMLRRKDLYVVVILSALLVIASYSFTFFGVSGLEIFVRDMAFSGVGLFATVIGTAVATRQLPDEITRRTIYPMLARPITRGQLLIGKFVAAYLTAVLVFLVLALVAAVILLVLRLPLGAGIFLQYLYLKSLSFLWLCGFGVCLSVYASQGAAFTVTLLLCLGSGAFNRAFGMGYGPASATNPVILVLYGFLPHYSLFDITRKVVYGWDPIAFPVLPILTVYGLLISGFWLWLGWQRFRRQAL